MENFEIGVYGTFEITNITRDKVSSLTLVCGESKLCCPIYVYGLDCEYVLLGDILVECLEDVFYEDGLFIREKVEDKTIVTPDMLLRFHEIYTSKNIHMRICKNISKVETALYDVGLDLKTIRDKKYYKNLGYEYCTFEEYCLNEFNMSRSSVYRLISIVENLSKDFVSTLGQNKSIGISKFYILSGLTVEERVELIESTDIEKISCREFDKKAKEIKTRGETERDISPTSSSGDSEYKSQSKEIACCEKYGKRFVALVNVYKKLFNSCSTLLKYEHIEDGSCFDNLDIQALTNVVDSLSEFCNYFKAIQNGEMTSTSKEAVSIIDRLGDIYVNGINGNNKNNS